MAKGQFGGKDKKSASNMKKKAGNSKEISESSESELDESDTEEAAVEFDGLSSVISKIVNQNVKKNVPVLEKRKVTNVLREASKSASEEGRNEHKKKKSNSHEVAELTPEGIQAEQARLLASLTKERNLKKVATKGVIALFNAIMESKRRAEGDEEPIEQGRKATSSSDKEAINKEVKNLTKSKFLELIAGNDDGSSKKSAPPDEDQRKTEDASSSAGSKQRGWDVLADDDDGEHKADLKLRDWDKSSDEDSE